MFPIRPMLRHGIKYRARNSDQMTKRLMSYIRRSPDAPCVASQLTTIGITQHGMLGLFLSNRYSNLLKSSNFSLISTLYSRTIISLLSLKSKLLTAGVCQTPIEVSESSYFCIACKDCPAISMYKRASPS